MYLILDVDENWEIGEMDCCPQDGLLTESGTLHSRGSCTLLGEYTSGLGCTQLGRGEIGEMDCCPQDGLLTEQGTLHSLGVYTSGLGCTLLDRGVHCWAGGILLAWIVVHRMDF